MARPAGPPGGVRHPTGVCVIRAEPLSEHRALISITTSCDVEAGNLKLSQTASRREALRLVADFLDDWERARVF